MRDSSGVPGSTSPAAPGHGPAAEPRVARALTVALAVLLAVLGAALALASLASYDWVKERLDELASDGDAALSASEFDAIVLRLRLAAVLAGLAAAAVVVWRRPVARGLAELGRSTRAAAVDLVRSLRGALATESRLHLGALGLVTLAALLVRLEFLLQPMRYDESVTYVHYASQPWYIALTTYTAPNNHVLHSELVHLSTLLFGDAPWAIRLPAFLAGVLLVPAAYVAGRRLYDKHAGLLAAALVAGSSVLVEYSTNARGYTLAALVVVLLLALATRLAESRSLAEWLAFSILAALGFLTVPVLLYGYGSVLLWLALTLVWSGQRRLLVRRLLPSVAVTAALTLLLYAPVVAASGLGSLVDNEFVRALPWSTFADELPGSVRSTLAGWHRDVPLPLAALLGLAFLAGLVLHRRVSRFAIPPALAALAFVVPVVVLQRVVPFERVWLELLPLYLLTAAAGVVAAGRPLAARVGGPALATAVLAVVLAAALAGTAAATRSVAESEDTSTFRDGATVAALLRPGDRVVVAPPADGILEYHVLRRGLDPERVLYWDDPATRGRVLVVVKQGPDDYPLEVVLEDPRLDGAGFGRPRLLRSLDEATVWELPRAR